MNIIISEVVTLHTLFDKCPFVMLRSLDLMINSVFSVIITQVVQRTFDDFFFFLNVIMQ